MFASSSFFMSENREETRRSMGKKMKKRLIMWAPLPEDIIEEILYRLPPKSLLRFKSVCQSWRSRIRSRQFIKNHLNKSTHQKLILGFREPRANDCAKSYPLESFVDRVPEPTATILKYPARYPFDAPLSIHGSCNGLLLAVSEYYGFVILWNPSIRKARRIYLPLKGKITVCGLMYDHSADDYRIVCIYPHATEIYSMRSDSWNKIENLYEGRLVMDGSAKFVNTRPHWIAFYDDDDDWDIVCLDYLGKDEERFEVVAKPDWFLSSSSFYPQCLRVLGGELGLVCFDNTASGRMNVWVMKEYGVRESWVQILNISNLWRERVQRTHLSGAPLGLLPSIKEGDSVLAFGSTLIFYDAQSNLHDICTDVVLGSWDANVYVETLVSPFAHGPKLATDLLSLSSWLKLPSLSS